MEIEEEKLFGKVASNLTIADGEKFWRIGATDISSLWTARIESTTRWSVDWVWNIALKNDALALVIGIHPWVGREQRL